MAGTLYVVATPIGNLEDITARALRVLREVHLIAAEDTRRTSQLLVHYGITTPTTSLHEHNEHQKSAAIVKRLVAGDSVAVVSDAGTPGVSDPGAGLVEQALAAGIRVEPIPGASALTAILSVAGAEFSQFTFLGFPPARGKDRKLWFERLAKSGPAAVFYESPHRIRPTLEEALRTLGDVQLVVGRELTKAHEELVRGPISTVLGRFAETRGEFVVLAIIGETTENVAARPAISAADVAAEFDAIISSDQMTRRQAIASLSRRHGMPASAIYDAIEDVKRKRRESEV